MDIPESICLVASDGREFYTFRKTLSEHSDFFAAMFNSGMKDSQETRINLPTLSAVGLESALGFMKNGSIKCILDSMPEVLEVCTYLQMGKLINHCVQELGEILSCETCFKILELGEEFMLPHLRDLALGYMTENFSDVTKKEAEFSGLDPENLVALLGSKISVASEIEVFGASQKWLIQNQINEPDIIDRIFSCVRFPLMSETALNECLQELKSFNIESLKVFSDIKTAQQILNDPLYIIRADIGEKAMPRRLSRCLLKLGGLTRSNGCTNRMMVTAIKDLADPDIDHVTWKYLPPGKGTPKLPTPLCEQSLVLLGPFLYVAGGQTHYSIRGTHVARKVHRYDTRINTWATISPMDTRRCLFYLAAVGDYLYAVGGNVCPRVATPTVERYDPHGNTWTYVSSLEIGIAEHAGCCFDGAIYVSGGYRGSEQGHLNRVWRYDPCTDTWCERCPMAYSRSYHCMVSNQHVFVMGGVNYLGDDSFEDVMGCEMYNPASDQWTVICGLPRYASCMTYHLIDDKIYLFGGHSFAENSNHQCVQIYDIATGEWTEKELNNKNICYYQAIETYLPEDFVSKFNR